VTAFWRASPDGVTVQVKVQPKSRRPGLQGIVESPDGPRLRIAVCDAPEDGRATRAACAALARALAVPATTVRLIHGAASREKTLAIAGDPAALISRLAAL
jgi:uncharacterized protein YggU (UPF0235/DUF167 family)